MRPRLDFATITLAYIVLTLLLGGASAGGFGANLVLQVLGAALIAACLWRRDPLGALPATGMRWFALATAVVVLVQFLPLPFSLWQALPGRAEAAAAMAMLGAPKGWMTVSFSPWASLASLAWWIPAVALFLACLRSDSPSAGAIVRAVVVIAVASVALGLLQRGGDSLYIYQISSFGLATGFFANANHEASFLLAALALWAGHHVASRAKNVRLAADKFAEFRFYAVALVLVFGILMTNSLAVTGLLLPVGMAVLLMSRPQLRTSAPLLLGAMAMLVGAVIWLAVSGALQENFAQTAGGPGLNRLAFLATGLAVAADMAPMGSGLGTFVDVYHWFESPETIGTTYVNHAHNDLLEVVIEAGVFGVAAIAVFLVWWQGRVRMVWATSRGNAYARAATIFTGAVLIHSLFDYPLRTAAISGLFAVACALIVRPQGAARHERVERSATVSEARVVI